jgi:hypothetical protein
VNSRIILVAALLLTSVLAWPAQPVHAQNVKVEFLMGKVNLTAQNATLRAILTEWSRVGGMRIINPERLTGGPVSLELTNVPERQALDILMRDVGGFMVGPRQTLVPGVSAFDRLVVVTSTAGRATAPGPAFTPAQPLRRPTQVPPPLEVSIPADELDGDDDADGPISPAIPRPGARGPQAIVPGLAPAPDNTESRPAPATSPRAPFSGVQGTSRPGVVTPVVPARETPGRPREDSE